MKIGAGFAVPKGAGRAWRTCARGLCWAISRPPLSFPGYAAGGFLLAIFVLMMGLSAGRPIQEISPATIWPPGAWRRPRFSVSLILFARRDDPRRVADRSVWEAGSAARSEVACLILGIGSRSAFIAFFAWHAARDELPDSWQFKDMSTGVIAVPLWVPQLGYWAGL